MSDSFYWENLLQTMWHCVHNSYSSTFTN